MTYRLIGPEETLIFGNDWADWLGSATIAASAWSTTATGPTLADPDFQDTTTAVSITGVLVGQIVDLVNTVTTSTGEVGSRTITLRGAPR